MSNPDRTDQQGRLLGPTTRSEYASWRRARDKRIADPPRAKTINDRKTQEKPK